MLSDAQKRANKKYDKKCRVTYSLKLNRINEDDSEIIEFLSSIENKNEFIKKAILEAMKKAL